MFYALLPILVGASIPLACALFGVLAAKEREAFIRGERDEI